MSTTPNASVIHGDCIEMMNAMPPESVDAIVTDPPYGLGFMGKKWDDLPPSREWAEACYRVLKPGGHIAAFGGTRTWHRLAVAIEDAGFEMRDSLAWLYGSGFPKSHDVSKGIDKLDASDERLARAREFQSWLRQHVTPQQVNAATGTDMGHHLTTHPTQPAVATAELFDKLRPLLPRVPERIEGLVRQRTVESQNFKARAVTGVREVPRGHAFAGATYGGDSAGREYADTRSATPDAERWQGWGTALKPGHEPVVVARKPAGPGAILDTIGSQLAALEEACRRRVSGAARSSARTRADSSVARTATAPGSAATQHEAGQEPTTATGEAGGSSAATVTSASEWTAETFLSTVTSWRECLAEISAATSTSTTSTATSRTTDLQTLSSCLSSIMQSVTAQSTLDPRSWSSLATAADNLFAAGVLSSRSTLALSATESATASTPHAPQAEGGSSAAFEPVVLARKPLAEKTVARNVLAHGTGAINIDACRIETDDNLNGGGYSNTATTGTFLLGGAGSVDELRALAAAGEKTPNGETAALVLARAETAKERVGEYVQPSGRWPANVLLDQHAAAWVDEQSGVTKSSVRPATGGPIFKSSQSFRGGGEQVDIGDRGHADQGGASRFFYTAKAPKRERPNVDGVQHPTVKPLAIMRWLLRLVTPPGGTVLDPFAGSGATIEAAIIEGFSPIGIELEAEYLPLIQHRIDRQAGDES